VLPTSRSDAPSGRTELNSPSLANFLYQHGIIQQTKRDLNKQNKNKKLHQVIFKVTRFYSFDLPSTFKQAIEAVQLSWDFCEKLSERFVRVFFTA